MAEIREGSPCVAGMGLEVLLRVKPPQRSDAAKPIVVKLLDKKNCVISKGTRQPTGQSVAPLSKPAAGWGFSWPVGVCADPLLLPYVSDEDLSSLSKPFSVDYIFDTDAAQLAVYQFARPLIASTFALGGEAALLVYGERGAGKVRGHSSWCMRVF